MEGGKENPGYNCPPAHDSAPINNPPQDKVLPKALGPGIGMLVFAAINFIITIVFAALYAFPIDTFIAVIIYVNCGIQAVIGSRLTTSQAVPIVCLLFSILSIIMAMVELILAILGAMTLQYKVSVDTDAYWTAFGIIVFLAVISVPPVILSIFLTVVSSRRLCGRQSHPGVYVPRSI